MRIRVVGTYTKLDTLELEAILYIVIVLLCSCIDIIIIIVVIEELIVKAQRTRYFHTFVIIATLVSPD